MYQVRTIVKYRSENDLHAIQAEVLGKRVVVQHLPLGGLIAWDPPSDRKGGRDTSILPASVPPATTAAPWAAPMTTAQTVTSAPWATQASATPGTTAPWASTQAGTSAPWSRR
jgi:serine/threonine-protein phosphatase 2A activator